MAKQKTVAQIIKAKLKVLYPNLKFSAKYSSFAGGDSVDVYWNLGVTESEIHDLLESYQSGHFDGMTDSYDYKERQKEINPDGEIVDMPSAKYVHGKRSSYIGTDKYDDYEAPELMEYVAKAPAKFYEIEWKGLYETHLISNSTERRHTAGVVARTIINANSFDTSRIDKFEGLVYLGNFNHAISISI